MCLEWLCVCLPRVSAGTCCFLGALSGSGVGALRGPSLSAGVEMDEMETVMNA